MSTEIRSTSPAPPWVGGKRNLGGRVIERLSAIPHNLYAEPFVGMGGIFLRRPFKAPVEIINDYGRDVATLFRVLQRHYVPFLDMLRYQIASRAEFDRLSVTDPDTLTDLERCARFLFLQRTAFGGKVAGRNFGVSTTAPARFDVTKLVPVLEAVHERLSGVTIECLPYLDFIERYDRPYTLFYLDPPYFGSEGDYGAGLFERADFERIATRLASLRGHFLLSINDRPEVREIFAAFDIESLETTYTIAGRGTSKRVSELLIKKFREARAGRREIEISRPEGAKSPVHGCQIARRAILSRQRYLCRQSPGRLLAMSATSLERMVGVVGLEPTTR